MKYKKKLNINVSQKDVDNYNKYMDALNGIGKHKTYERPYVKLYKSMLNYTDLKMSSVIIYSVIRNLIQVDYLSANKNGKRNNINSGELEIDANGNSVLVGRYKKITYDTLKDWSGINSDATIKSALEELIEYEFISRKSGKKTSNEYTLLRDIAIYQPEEIEAFEKFTRENYWDENLKNSGTDKDNDGDDFDW